MTDISIKIPLLSIAIPTYNRPQKLRKCLLSIINQISEEVEIVVTDNSDNNESYFVIKELIDKSGVNINYYHNEVNIGLDGNFYEGVKRSNGIYVHWLSDDDELMPNILSTLLCFIAKIKDTKSFVFLNSIGFEEKDNERLWKTPWLKLNGKECFDDVENALNEIGSDMTFVSSYCFHRESWINVSAPSKHFGTNLYLTYTLMAFLGKYRSMFFIRTPIIAHRHDYTGNFHLLRPFTIELQKALVNYSSECGLDKKKLIKVYNNILSKLVFELIVGIKCNYFIPKGKINYMSDVVFPCWRRKAFWFKLFPAILLPQTGYTILRYIRKTVKKKIYN